uniref:Uncharacterized protein n=1 Tax=Glossina austeni TaxID=7395 RepID=A0A1A9V151_GLOAU
MLNLNPIDLIQKHYRAGATPTRSHGFCRARKTDHQLHILLHLQCDYGITQLDYFCFRDVGVGQITPFNKVYVCVKHGKSLLVCSFFLLAKWQRCKATYVAIHQTVF